jgi:hypothetical protein
LARIGESEKARELFERALQILRVLFQRDTRPPI